MFQQIISLINVHLKEFFREPGIIFWAILFPILMAWGLGLAFTKKGELLRTVALVQEEEAENRQWTSFMENEAYSAESEEQRKLGNEALGITTYRFVAAPWDEAVIMLKRGKTDLILQVSADSLRYHFDPLNPEAQLTYLQLSSALNGFDMPEHKARIKPLEQKGTRYIDFLVPGLMAMGVMMSCMWGISYNNVDKRGKKLMRRMVATPMKKSSYLIAQFSSRLLLSGVESLLLLLFTWLYFDTEIQGSIPAFIPDVSGGQYGFYRHCNFGLFAYGQQSGSQWPDQPGSNADDDYVRYFLQLSQFSGLDGICDSSDAAYHVG